MKKFASDKWNDDEVVYVTRDEALDLAVALVEFATGKREVDLYDV